MGGGIGGWGVDWVREEIGQIGQGREKFLIQVMSLYSVYRAVDPDPLGSALISFLDPDLIKNADLDPAWKSLKIKT